MIMLPTRLPRFHTAFTVTSVDAGTYISTHSHAEFELVLVAQGHISSKVAGHQLDGPPGTVYILPAGVPHNQQSGVPWVTKCVKFEQLDIIIEEIPRTLDISGDARLCRWIADLCEFEPHWPATDMGIQNSEIGVGLLLAVLRTINQLERQDQLRGEMHPQLLRAVEFLVAHMSDDISLHDLADIACVSGSHLSALFRQQFGCGPIQYQQRLRIDSARALLRNPYLSIEEVASQCGYSDANYFARLFRSVTGLRPSQWRREAQ